jgi:hypothetical protein
VGPQRLQQPGRQRHAAVLAALALADPQEHAAAVDVGHAQPDDLTGAQAGGVGRLQQQAVDGAGLGGKEPGHLVAAEDRGQALGLLAVGDLFDQEGAGEGQAVEQAEGADHLVEGTPGGVPLVQQVQLVGADLGGPELLGGAAEVAGEAHDGRGVGLDGAWAVVAELQILDKALA